MSQVLLRGLGVPPCFETSRVADRVRAYLIGAPDVSSTERGAMRMPISKSYEELPESGCMWCRACRRKLLAMRWKPVSRS